MQDNFEMVITFLKYNFTLNDLDLKPCERNNAAAGRDQRKSVWKPRQHVVVAIGIFNI